MPKIYDNIENMFADGLKGHLREAKRVDYCVGYFNLRGWGLVSDHIDTLTGDYVYENEKNTLRFCRLLIGMSQTPNNEIFEEFADPDDLLLDNEKAIRLKTKLANELKEQLTFGLPTQEHENSLKKLLYQLIEGKVVVKLFLKHQLHAKLYISHNESENTPIISLLGSSNFTLAGLSKQGELNIDVMDQDATNKLTKWFIERWEDRWCIDINKELIAILENCWARPTPIPPFYIYLKIAYHLSREARTGLTEYTLSKEFAKELLDFQQAAVKIAAHHVHTRRGVMIGDVVGLGKTITATAIAKIFEDDLYYNTLIVCPKNLVAMWEGYVHKYHLHAKIISQTMLRKELPTLRRYRLMIVDESHNFRNNQTKDYKALKTYIDDNDCKVVLLSATPYNKSFIDLANQLKLFIPEDFDLGIIPESYINHLGGAVQFASKHTDTNIRTINAFEKSNFADDWREIMKYYLVRRTKSFIKENFAQIDPITQQKYLVFSSGERSYFPQRISKKIEFSLDKNDVKDQYASLYKEKMVDMINSLHLPRYGLQQYFDKDTNIMTTEDEETILANLSRAGKRVIGFCRTNLYKRLESCGYSFLLSISRHILRNHIFIYAIGCGYDLPVSGASVDVDIYTDEDMDNDNSNSLNMDFNRDSVDFEEVAKVYYRNFKFEHTKRFDWIRSSLFDTEKLLCDLKSDTEKLLSILLSIKKWQPVNDRKLNALKYLLSETHKNEKILVFTQYADTAVYIHEGLKSAGVEDTAISTGSSENIVKIVQHFSPKSNDIVLSSKEKPIRILITTDILSEGQNLQDAHIVVNFDLPWALVRLIQRAGRVDRIGQKSPEILCYSFLPEEGIESIIGLRKKLKTRISENAEVVGSDEVFFEGDPINISDLYSGRTNILDDEEYNEVDLASYAYQIWKNGIDEYPQVKSQVENLPNVVFSSKFNDTHHEDESVIVYAKTKDHNDAMVWLDSSGKIVTLSQFAILKAAECSYFTPPETKLEKHHELVAQGVKLIQSETNTITGVLGRKNSTKYRTYMRVNRFYEETEGTALNKQNLKNALDAIFQHQLLESAIESLSRQMKAGIDDENLANLVISLFESERLCVMSEAVHEIKSAQIICSMGLVKGAN